MKKIVLVLMIALMGIVVNAQPPRQHRGHGDPAQMVERRVEHLAKFLDLTEDQKAEVTKIYSMEAEAMKKEHQQIAADGTKPERPDESVMKARREQMKARRAETDAKVEALLTPEQAAKFAQFKDHKGRMGKGDRHEGDRRSHKRGEGGCCGKCKQEQ